MSKISGITTVCFDIDWTLVKHNPDAEYELLRKLNHEPDPEFRRQALDFWQNVSKKLQNGKRVERQQIYEIAERFIPYLRKLNLTGEEWYHLQATIDFPTLIEGAYEILEYLQNEGYFIVASTNAFVSEQTNVLKKLKILDFFERIYGWDTTCAKPHKRSLDQLLKAHSPDAIIMIGDSVYTDIQLANRLGIKSIGVNLKYEKGLKRIKPTEQISRLEEIGQYL